MISLKRCALLPLPATLLLLALSACSENQADKKPAPPPVPVTTALAITQDVPLSLDFVGRAEAYESVTLKARVDGEIAAVRFTEGQHVHAGELLLQLDPTDFNARLHQAEANVARDEAQLAKARADSARYLALKQRNFISDEKLNDIRTIETAQAASLHADQAALELARAQLSYATIRAPFAGIVGARLVFPGSAVKTNDTALAVVNRVRPLLVSFALPEKYLAQIKTAMGKPGDKLKVGVSLPGEKGARSTGEIRFLDNAVDASSGTVQMKALLANDDERLTPGQFLNVSLRLGTLLQAVTVPNEAVQQGPEGNFIFVVKADKDAKADSSVEVRKVNVVATNNGISAIDQGLQAGEMVVTDGQLRLTSGAKIKAKENPLAPSQAPASPSAARN